MLSRMPRSAAPVVPSPLRSVAAVPQPLRRSARSAAFTVPSPFRSPAVAVPHDSQRSAARLAQRSSHSMPQQKPSTAQTASQHAASEQEGVPFLLQQSPASGLPQSSEHAPQTRIASSAHTWSHAPSQQKGSAVQIARQHSLSEHAGVVRASQQSPASGSPQPVVQTVQPSAAMFAQNSSHTSTQQNGSSTQTARQQFASAQPGEFEGWQQLAPPDTPHTPPQSPQRIPAASAHAASHATSQQRPSNAHTASQQRPSEQLGVACGVQQSPEPGAPQPIPQIPHESSAAFAQTASHASVQQKGSAAQTRSQQIASEQDGAMRAMQHSPAAGLPHSSAQVPQNSIAAVAHFSSHWTSQQKLSAAQMSVQQKVSLHAGVACASQQSPEAGSPQPTPQTPQASCACPAHTLSHSFSQQKGSTPQIASQQSSLEQPGPSCGTQQSSLEPPPHGTEQMPQN